MTVVVDASFVCRCVIPSQVEARAIDALTRLISERRQLSAPFLLSPEVASAIRRTENRGLLDADDRQKIWRAFRAMPISYR